MKRIIYLLFIWTGLFFSIYARDRDTRNDIIIENNQFKLVIGEEKNTGLNTANHVIVPASNRHYIKTKNLSVEALRHAFKNARIIE